MSLQARRPASSKQIGYIKRLQAEVGVRETGVPPDLTNWQASKMIGELLSQKKTSEFVPADQISKTDGVNHTRLGLAMKMCFRLWSKNGYDIWDTHREAFKKRVIATYNLFTEIAETMDQKAPVVAYAQNG